MEQYFLDTTIDELYHDRILSTRAYRELENNGIFALGDVANKLIKNKNGVPRVKNVGQQNSDLLIDLFNKIDVNEPISPEQHSYLLLPDNVRKIVDRSFNQISNDIEFGSVILRHYNSSYDLFIKFIAYNGTILDFVENLSCDDYRKLRTAYLLYCKNIKKDLETESLTNSMYYKLFNRSFTVMYANPIQVPMDIVTENLSEKQSSFIQRKYEEICRSVLSTRALNFCQKHLSNFRNVIPYFDKEDIVSDFLHKATMSSTNKEIVKMLSAFKASFMEYHKADDFLIDELVIKEEYPFLSKEEMSFVLNHLHEYGKKPMLFLLYKYMTTSQDVSNRTFCLTYGLYDGKGKTTKELANSFHLSGSRIRQMLTELEVFENPILFDKEWANYVIPQDYLLVSSTFYADLSKRENLNVPFTVFGRLLSLKFDVKIDTLMGNEIIIINDYLKRANLHKYFSYIGSLINGVHYNDDYYSMQEIVNDQLGLYDSVMIPLTQSILQLQGNVTFVDDIFMVNKNKTDIVAQLELCLSQENRPLSLESLFSKFKENNPVSPCEQPSQIKTYIKKSKKIVPIGNQGVYGLQEWSQINFNNIRGTIEAFLKEAKSPVKIDEILKFVQQHFPNTNSRSIMTSLDNDESGRFVRFENNCYGLRSMSYNPSFVIYNKIHNYTLDERISQFESFCEVNHRFPLLEYSDETESSLSRWYGRIRSGLVKLNKRQKDRLESIVRRYELMCYPKSKTELLFLENCKKYIDYIVQHDKRPPASHPLAIWLCRTRRIAHRFNDIRNIELEKLLDFISKKGF